MAAAKRRMKTVARTADPIAFIDKVKSEVKRKDSHELVAMMQDVTGEPPKMWGPSIIGFGTLPLRVCERPRGRDLPDGLLAALGRARRLSRPRHRQRQAHGQARQAQARQGLPLHQQARRRRPRRAAQARRVLGRGAAQAAELPLQEIAARFQQAAGAIAIMGRSCVLLQQITSLGDPMRTKTILASALATLFTAGTAFAQAPAQQPAQPQPYRVGTPLSATNEAGQVKTNVEQRESLRQLPFRRELHVRSGPQPDRRDERRQSAEPGQSAAAEPNDGFVSLINPDGSVHTSKWIGATRDGLTLVHPLGSAIQGGTLYINDGNTIRTFDLKTGTPKQAFEVREAMNLNGIGVAPDGTMYASNTGNAQQPENKQRIYKVTAAAYRRCSSTASR